MSALCDRFDFINLQLFSTVFIFLRHPRVGGDPDGTRSEPILIFT